MGQERSVWADTPRELNLGGDVRRGRGLEGQPEKAREVRSSDKDEDRRMSWAYLYEPKY